MEKTVRCLIISLSLLLAAWSAGAQEKVYVHLDRTYYAAGETAWLKAYIEDVQDADSSAQSRFLYVELLDPAGGTPLLRTKIKEGPDGLSGHFDFPDTLHSGNYLLRAYTRWQLDGPESALFHVPVKIFGAEGELPEPESEGDEPDVTFYAEGGRYYAGQMAIFGFKVMGPDGAGRELKGTVCDDLGQVVAQARTSHQGMGIFGFTPEAGRSYRLHEEGTGRTWSLPAPSDDGATLQVRRLGDKLTVTALNHTGAPCRLFLRVAGEDIFVSDIAADGQQLRIAADNLKEGLQKFILADLDGNILSERAVFGDGSRVTPVPLTIKAEEEGFSPRTKHSVRLRLPVDADQAQVSVSIVRSAFRPYVQEGGVASYMLLGSELRGHIADPDYYFDPKVPEADRRRNLDLLLMIQGWTYYDTPFVPKEEKERVQSLRGTIKGLGRRTPRNYSLAILAPAIEYSQVVTVPMAGSFYIDSLDFRDSTLFMMNVTRDGLMQSYTAGFAPDPVAPDLPGWKKEWRMPQWRPASLSKGEAEGPVAVPFAEGLFVDTIKTVVVQAQRIRMRSPFGSAPVTNPQTREKLSPYDHMNILNYMLMMHPTWESTSGEAGETTLRETREYDNFGYIKLCVNGTELPWDLGESILIGDVETLSFERSTSDTFLMKSYGLVLVELSGPIRKTLSDQANSTVFVPLGWQTPRLFYHPRYDKALREWMPDKRNTIYWCPLLDVWSLRHSLLTFYTDDQLDGPYLMRVEGRTSDGRWISEECLLY